MGVDLLKCIKEYLQFHITLVSCYIMKLILAVYFMCVFRCVYLI